MSMDAGGTDVLGWCGMQDRAAVVVTVQAHWRRDGTGRPQRYQRVRVEYVSGEETRRAVGELFPGAAPVKPGDRVTVRLRPGHRATVTPLAVKRSAPRHEVRNGVLAYAGLVVLVLLISGSIYFGVTLNPDRYLPTGPSVPSSPVEPSVSGR
ncbi:hypothetical protein [Virgisporangium aurantiacum]|uniref:hypothetical protein n=1 Tax=Virgisporangium aurantiacum TaxID=175570 RepID=UPI0019517F97|nr:hypothetical protein [Virgisporangium aurantiacum]